MFELLIDKFENSTKDNFTRQEVIDIIRGEIDSKFNEEVESNGVRLVPSEAKMIYDNKSFTLPIKVYKVLHFLISNRNKCMSRNALLKNCWESGVVVGDRTIDVHICKIKRLLKDKSVLKTRKGFGYMWIDK